MKPARQSNITVNATAELRRVELENAQNRRAHVEAMFRMGVPAIIVLAGLCFMATGIPGGKELVVGAAAYFAGGRLPAGHTHTQRRTAKAGLLD
jgi:hypothetical protein